MGCSQIMNEKVTGCKYELVRFNSIFNQAWNGI